MRRQMEAFLQHLRGERRLSPHTVAGYERDLENVFRFCRQRGIDSWQALTANHLRTFVAERHQHGLSGRSLRRALSALRGLYRFLLRDETAAHNPAQGLSAPKSSKRLPKTLSPD